MRSQSKARSASAPRTAFPPPPPPTAWLPGGSCGHSGGRSPALGVQREPRDVPSADSLVQTLLDLRQLGTLNTARGSLLRCPTTLWSRILTPSPIFMLLSHVGGVKQDDKDL